MITDRKLISHLFLGLCIKASHVCSGYLHDDELFIIDVFMFVFFALPWSIKSVTDMFTQCHSLHCLQLTFTINIYNFSYLKEIFFSFPIHELFLYI